MRKLSNIAGSKSAAMRKLFRISGLKSAIMRKLFNIAELKSLFTPSSFQPALLELGFRPFFFLGALYSLISLLVWGVGFLFPHEEISDPNPSKFLILMWPLYPWLKMGVVFLPYINLLNNLKYDYARLQRRLELIEMRRRERIVSIAKF